MSGSLLVLAFYYDYGLFSPLLSRRNEFQKKAACITRRWVTSIIMKGEKAWDLKAILAGRLQNSCLGDFDGSLPLSMATQR